MIFMAAGLILLIPCRQIHEIPRRLAILLALERDVEIGRGAEHVEQRPEREAAAAVLREAEVDLHMLDPRLERLGAKRGEIGGAEIAAELVVEVHSSLLTRPALKVGRRNLHALLFRAPQRFHISRKFEHEIRDTMSDSDAFPPRPENWDEAEQQKEVYARFGLAVYHAQVFEHSIANFLLTAELVKAVGVVRTQEAWERLVDHTLDSSFELTLGNMIKRVFDAIGIDEREQEEIRVAKRNRDELCHRFFREHAEQFMTPSGRLKMLDRLETLGSQIRSATAIVDLIEGATAKLLGQTPEKRAAFTEAYLDEIFRADDT